MKKAVIGCLLLLAVLAVGAGVASYLAYRKVSSTLAGFAELGTVPELERPFAVRAPSPHQLLES